MRLVETIPPRCAVDTQAYCSHQPVYDQYQRSTIGKHVTLRLSVVGDQWVTIRPSLARLRLDGGDHRLSFSASRPHGRYSSSDRRVAWSNYFLQDGWVGPSFDHLAAFGLKVLS
jgi:hypothetical protein